MNKTLQNYKSQIKPVWCPGCGNYAVLRALQQAFLELNLSPEEILSVSGIGCSGRMSHYLNTYSLHGTHGRAVPTALGAKAARPDLTVLAIGGDGDGLGIGGGHISHAARKNVDITYILVDNRIYGLTKGQASPTTPFGQKTKTSPYGVSDLPMNPIPIFITYDISFVARSASTQLPEMTDLLKKAIQHKGMSLVYVFSPCATFPIMTYSDLREMLQPLPKDHPKDNLMVALERAYSQKPVYTGIFFQTQRPTLEDHLTEFISEAAPKEKPPADKWALVKRLFEDYS
jgi:2-oxoglutarate ferredoxin oxidoreductase subunit beta